MSYFKEVNGKLVSPPKNFKNQDGSIIINFNLNEEKLIEQGYRQYTDEEIQQYNAEQEGPDITSYRFSKLKVKEKLVELNLWTTIKNSLTEDEKDDLFLANDFAFDNTTFVKFYNQLKNQIQNIDEILIQCSI